MLYIVKRTQLYLDDDLWQALHTKAAIEKTTVSDLVRTAARKHYLDDSEKRQKALMALSASGKTAPTCLTPRPMCVTCGKAHV